MLEGGQQAIFDGRDHKLEEARALRGKTRAAKSSAKFEDSVSNQEPTVFIFLSSRETAYCQEVLRAALRCR